MIHEASTGRSVMIDGRERAPLAAHRDMYLDQHGEIIPRASMDGALAAGIPGQAAALVHLADKYGTQSLKRLLRPAIELAQGGFVVDAYYRRMATFRLSALRQSRAAARLFLHKGEVPAEGYRIIQSDLAKTLRILAEKGHAGFYAGSVAQALVKSVQDAGGIWQLRDLSEYAVVERTPITFDYDDFQITSVPPPSSGGVALATMLNILENYSLENHTEVQRIHLIVEAMRRAYEDRANYLGDTDHVDVPLKQLISKQHAKDLAASINQNNASVSRLLPNLKQQEGSDTTHFSILDNEGNRIAATLSINYPFGSGFVAGGTGVLLNDEMDDFSAQSGTPNAYGLVGNEANAIAPGKRMLSSMSPSFVENNDMLAIIGTPGGSRIITMVLLGMLEAMDDKAVQAWVERPRFHHQYLPDLIQFEPGAFSPKVQKRLAAMGHRLKALKSQYGNMQVVRLNKNTGQVTAHSDSRGVGQAMTNP